MYRARVPRAGAISGPSLGLARLGAFALATLAGFAFLGWLGWTGVTTREEMRAASQRAVRVAELRGMIVYYDEWLTMAAQMAAASGERRWAERFDEAAPKLDATIAEAIELATPEIKAALFETTDEAHRDLDTMERRALALAAEGSLPAARALLNGPDFSYLKDVYAAGIEVFGQDLTTLAVARASSLSDRAWMEAAGLGLSTLFLVSTALMVLGRARLQGALARTAAVARTDALTELPNRRRFYEELETAFADIGQTGGSYALLLIDLDRFKAANDAYGHLVGDELLRLVARRLRAFVHGGDLIARLGGDEFALLVSIGKAAAPPPESDPARMAGRIVSALDQPFILAEGTLARVGASIGIAIAQPGGGGVAELMRRADVALYRAKADGRSCFRFFEQGMDTLARSRALLEGELRRAIADDAIVPHFQPVVEIDTGRLVGVEMLARWPHPIRGMVPPGEFIPIAEDLGLIGPLTDRLLRRACRAAAKWPAPLALACNVSPVQLRDPALPAMVRAVLEETDFPAGRLELEVTESALVGDLALARTLLDQLKGLGVRLSLDDFGTGYSSLRHLQSLPFDKLKIDASFVGAMTADKESQKIVAAVVGLGHSLGLSTVAEGIETEQTAALLRDLGCDLGQGWLFGRPDSADQIDALLREATRAGLPAMLLAS